MLYKKCVRKTLMKLTHGLKGYNSLSIYNFITNNYLFYSLSFFFFTIVYSSHAEESIKSSDKRIIIGYLQQKVTLAEKSEHIEWKGSYSRKRCFGYCFWFPSHKGVRFKSLLLPLSICNCHKFAIKYKPCIT